MIELKHVQKDYGSAMPLQDLNAIVHDGDVVGVIGPSGCGKSTLLRCINLLDPPTAGQIFLDGEEITAPGFDASKMGRKMGMVFQHFNLFGHWSVIRNIMQPQIDLLGRTKQQAYDKAMELLRLVGLAGKAFARPDELSGGQKQRVAIARTLAMDPEVVLFDEPTSALDPTMVGEVQGVIRLIAREGRTMMIVTHDMAFARDVCSRIFYLDEGGLYEEGTPAQIFEHPRRPKTRRFVYLSKVLEISIEPTKIDFLNILGQIDNYCLQNHIPLSMATWTRLVFEELCLNIVAPLLSPTDKMLAVFEYQQDGNELLMSTEYSGEQIDPLVAGDELAVAIVRGSSKRVVHSCIDSDGFTNRIELTLKNDK